MKALTATIGHTGGDDELRVSVSFARFDGDRDCYAYTIADQDGAELMTGEDLRGPAQSGTQEVAMLATLLAFLSSAGESYHYNGNRTKDDTNTDLFPEKVCELAYLLSDEISSAVYELEGSDDE